VALATANPADRNLVAEVAAGVNGNGVILQGSARAVSAREAAGISCGFNKFSCYTRLDPGQKILLRARSLAGYVFRAWTGSCAGQKALCVIVARALSTVSAIFAPRVARPGVGFEVKPVNIRILWRRSVGDGRMVVTGAVGGRASLRVQVRRPNGGPLVTRRVAVPGGQFRSVILLRKDALPRGATILPGGFVASVTGSSQAARLPFALRPIVIPAPLEGVVRRAFASTLRTGPATSRLPRRSRQAWAHFRFATQPSTKLPVTVTWYRPDGASLGFAKKSNRPEIVTFIRTGASSGLPSGSWIAELRAGKRIVMRLRVPVG
jgi:hypothetical protein